MKMPQLSARTRSKINTNCDSWGGARGVNLALPPCKRLHFFREVSHAGLMRHAGDPPETQRLGKALRILLVAEGMASQNMPHLKPDLKPQGCT